MLTAAALDSLAAWLTALAGERGRVLVGIDGMCAAGKTTLAQRLRERTGAAVFHTDDFYLPFARRTPARMAQPGGHLDWERLRAQLLLPLSRGASSVCYSVYDCARGALLPPVQVAAAPVCLIEGSYCLLPALREFYDLRVFLETTPRRQGERLAARETPESLERFRACWIPREEAYFAACAPRACCDLVFSG